LRRTAQDQLAASLIEQRRLRKNINEKHDGSHHANQAQQRAEMANVPVHFINSCPQR
jgi:hypothetical protein